MNSFDLKSLLVLKYMLFGRKWKVDELTLLLLGDFSIV